MEWPDLSPDPELLESVRKRPAMFFGWLGERANFDATSHLVDEAVGRYLEGHVAAIETHRHGDGSLSVVERIRPETSEHVSKLFREVLEDSRVVKGSSNRYPLSSFEVNARCFITAAAAKLEVTGWIPGHSWSQTFAKGQPEGSVVERRSPEQSSGISVRWLPDADVMEAPSVPANFLVSRLRTLSYLAPGLVFSVLEEGQQPLRFHSDRGLLAALQSQVLDRRFSHEPIHFTHEESGVFVDIAFAFVSDDAFLITGYANHRLAQSGGSHLDGFRAGLMAAMSEIQEREDPSLALKKSLCLREGLFAIVSVRSPKPTWAGATRGKLQNPELKPLIATLVHNAVRAAEKSRPEEWKWLVRMAHLSSPDRG